MRSTPTPYEILRTIAHQVNALIDSGVDTDIARELVANRHGITVDKVATAHLRIA